MILLVVFLALSQLTTSQFCQEPQRIGYLSFSALSGRDHLTYLFGNVSAKVDKFNSTYSKQNVDYNLTGVEGQYFYIDYEQYETFVDLYTANVTCGKLYLGIFMNYSVKNNDDGAVSKGFAMCKVLVDQFWFSKAFNVIEGVLSWKTKDAPSLTVSTIIGIEGSNPTLPTGYRQVFESMLNGYVGSVNLK